MNRFCRPLRSWRKQEGYALAVSAAFLTAMVAMIGLMVDFATVAYARASLGAAAEAAALGAVKDQTLIPLPIPRPGAFIGFVPVDGWLIPLIKLNNVEFLGGEPSPALFEIAKANLPTSADKFRLTKTYVPGISLSPLHFIKYTATAEVRLPFSGVLVKPVLVESEACGLAWVPVRHWMHSWWVAARELPNQHLKNYRLIKCGEFTFSPRGLMDVLDLASTLATQVVNEKLDEKTRQKARPPRNATTKAGGTAMSTVATSNQETQKDGWGDVFSNPDAFKAMLEEQYQQCEQQKKDWDTAQTQEETQYKADQAKWDAATAEQRKSMKQPVPPRAPAPADACDPKGREEPAASMSAKSKPPKAKS